MEIAVGEMALVVTYAASACYTAPYGYQSLGQLDEMD